MSYAMLVFWFLLPLAGQAQRPEYPAPLPPDIPWSGASEALIVPNEDPWVTPSEKSGLARTPTYAETVAWLQRLDRASMHITLISIGKSPEGRDIWMAVVSSEQGFAATAQSAKPLLLVQAGIHSGEIDGKDAGMMLLRDLSVRGTKKKLLESANVLFIPILNVDGHERSSVYNRINQKGPVEMGWRTTAQLVNLNRDYGKLDTPEMRALVQVLRRWRPDLYVDVHVTDGVDYQYDVTYGYNYKNAYSAAIAGWLDNQLRPQVNRDLELMGHIPGPLVFALDNRDLSKGIAAGPASLRFSNGYGDVCHVPTVLVENHSLKPYRQRVLGTYILLESMIRLLGEQGAEVRKAIATDRASRPADLPLSFAAVSSPDRMIPFLGVRSRVSDSVVSGGKKVEWTGEKQQLTVPYFESSKPSEIVKRPKAYWLSKAWSEVIRRLEAHGIQMEHLQEPREVEVDAWRITGYELERAAYEGHVQVRGAQTAVERRHIRYPAGSVRISTDQPLGDLAILLLEPGSPESFFQWGLFLSAFGESEYAEGYLLEPLAERMLSQDPGLKREFDKKLAEEPGFRDNPRQRLRWFYERSPFFENQKRYYPVARESR